MAGAEQPCVEWSNRQFSRWVREAMFFQKSVFISNELRDILVVQ